MIDFLEKYKNIKEQAVFIIFTSKEEDVVKSAREIATRCEELIDNHNKEESKLNEWCDEQEQLTQEKQVHDALIGR